MSKEKDKKLSSDIRDWQYNLDEKDLVVFEEYANTLERSSKDNDDDDESDGFSEEDYPIKLKELAMYNSHVGPIMVPEFTDPTKHFKLWTIYSKVPLSSKILLNIENTTGVETIEALTRYRARVGICPLFKDRPTLDHIKKIIEDASFNGISI